MTGREALERLLEGNRRYLEGGGPRSTGQVDRENLVDSQSPIVAILCCSDSRVPPEHVFDFRSWGDFCSESCRTCGGDVGPGKS